LFKARIKNYAFQNILYTDIGFMLVFWLSGKIHHVFPNYVFGI